MDFKPFRNRESTLNPILVPDTLRVGHSRVGLAASVDTGALLCLFIAEMAEAFGLNLEQGTHIRFRTANSQFGAFSHEVELNAVRVAPNSIVYFFGHPRIDKNVPGRNGRLDRVRLRLVHHDSKVFLAAYD